MKKKAKKKNSAAKDPGNGIFWYFPSMNHGEENGFADSLLEYFQGDHERYVAREAIQNAVDARLDNSKPVQVVFNKYEMDISDIPGSAELSATIRRCLDFCKGQEKAEKFFKSAIGILDGNKIDVLKISDYNTAGLSGLDDDRAGNWYRLVRATGTSSPKGVAGGSFGIGKGAPIAASLLRTVFYSSINDKDEAVFQGKSRLVSHYDKDKDVRQGVGFFGLDGYRAIRDDKLIPPAFSRDQRGTDIYILGYKSDEEWRRKLIRSVLFNFWLAILHGDLEVTVKDGLDVLITKDTIGDVIEEYDADDVKCFYEAVMNSTQQFEEDLKHLGKVQLYVRKQEGYPGKVIMARKPKMIVQEKAYRVLREPYAGVFLCADDRGNSLLRDLEPPAHDKWDKGRTRDVENGSIGLSELDNFIKDKLRSMGDSTIIEPQDIPGLDKYLPDSEEKEYSPKGENPFDPSRESSSEETGREIGANRNASLTEVSPTLRRNAVVKSPATGQGGIGGKPNNSSGGNKAGKGGGEEPGDGAGQRIMTADISFRSFVQKSGTAIEYHFVIQGREDCNGSIKVIAVGDDGSYPMDVESARNSSDNTEFQVSNSMINGLNISKGETLKLAVKLKSFKKYAISIENYEG